MWRRETERLLFVVSSGWCFLFVHCFRFSTWFWKYATCIQICEKCKSCPLGTRSQIQFNRVLPQSRPRMWLRFHVPVGRSFTHELLTKCNTNSPVYTYVMNEVDFMLLLYTLHIRCGCYTDSLPIRFYGTSFIGPTKFYKNEGPIVCFQVCSNRPRCSSYE